MYHLAQLTAAELLGHALHRGDHVAHRDPLAGVVARAARVARAAVAARPADAERVAAEAVGVGAAGLAEQVLRDVVVDPRAAVRVVVGAVHPVDDVPAAAPVEVGEDRLEARRLVQPVVGALAQDRLEEVARDGDHLREPREVHRRDDVEVFGVLLGVREQRVGVDAVGLAAVEEEELRLLGQIHVLERVGGDGGARLIGHHDAAVARVVARVAVVDDDVALGRVIPERLDELLGLLDRHARVHDVHLDGQLAVDGVDGAGERAAVEGHLFPGGDALGRLEAKLAGQLGEEILGEEQVVALVVVVAADQDQDVEGVVVGEHLEVARVGVEAVLADLEVEGEHVALILGVLGAVELLVGPAIAAALHLVLGELGHDQLETPEPLAHLGGVHHVAEVLRAGDLGLELHRDHPVLLNEDVVDLDGALAHGGAEAAVVEVGVLARLLLDVGVEEEGDRLEAVLGEHLGPLEVLGVALVVEPRELEAVRPPDVVLLAVAREVVVGLAVFDHHRGGAFTDRGGR